MAYNEDFIKTALSPQHIAAIEESMGVEIDNAATYDGRTISVDTSSDKSSNIRSNQSGTQIIATASDASPELYSALSDDRFDDAAIDDSAPVYDGEIVVSGRRYPSDHRIRISAFQPEQVYGPRDRENNILYRLYETEGLMFPYTPTISVSQDTTWVTHDLEQSNYDILSYQKTSSANITITGKFTVQNQREGEYLMAVIHFLKTVSKAYFGERDADQFVPSEAASVDTSTTGQTTAPLETNATASQSAATQLVKELRDKISKNDIALNANNGNLAIMESDLSLVLSGQQPTSGLSEQSIRAKIEELELANLNLTASNGELVAQLVDAESSVRSEETPQAASSSTPSTSPAVQTSTAIPASPQNGSIRRGRAGLPPPVLCLDGYGNMMFDAVRVVIKSHSWTFDETSDMIKINLPTGDEVWLPPVMTISLTLAIQQNTDTVREDFSLDKFRTGELMREARKGWF